LLGHASIATTQMYARLIEATSPNGALSSSRALIETD
jgi:site-specific recombinase XerD